MAVCITKKMGLDDICKKFDVKPSTVRNKLARLAAKGKGLESFFVSSSSARFPKVQKNGKFTVGL